METNHYQSNPFPPISSDTFITWEGIVENIILPISSIHLATVLAYQDVQHKGDGVSGFLDEATEILEDAARKLNELEDKYNNNILKGRI